MKNRWIIVTLIITTLISCKQNRFDKIPTPKNSQEVKIVRFENDLFSLDTISIESEYKELSDKHTQFADLFTRGIIRIGKSDSLKFYHYLKMFLTDTMVQNCYRMVSETFPPNADFEKELKSAFARYSYFFPEKVMPKVYTYISGYNLSLAIDDSLVAVGLDRYLGKNTIQYTLLGIPRYIQRKMNPQKVSSDVMRAWLYGVFPFKDSVNNLLSRMIYEGQIMYLTKRMLPNQPDSLIFGYTPQQYKWCQRNEKNIWTYLIENKLLFTTNLLDINKMINDAPFTSGFSRESPGRTAVWIGYRIVEQFMERNQEYTLDDLMKVNDYQYILNKAKYKP
ncbi:gliding motility lipoprotein GldB [Tenuifilum thalassicum]|uniref:Gliding motility lipoprotein GldB n=1 Tax=Tenuifilum thalassicum TaxID=2590900 RepID=A0A7D4BD32_9BACT|nr:hypothetical protein [Tenuifilum thalassicum]QKG79343.1 hypothetical protein FHG85_03370 [Tenuifilum thalassicum]